MRSKESSSSVPSLLDFCLRSVISLSKTKKPLPKHLDKCEVPAKNSAESPSMFLSKLFKGTMVTPPDSLAMTSDCSSHHLTSRACHFNGWLRNCFFLFFKRGFCISEGFMSSWHGCSKRGHSVSW